MASSMRPARKRISLSSSPLFGRNVHGDPPVTKERFEAAGVGVYGFGNSAVHNVDAIVLNLPNRDEKVEEYKNHIRALGRAGIPYTTYAHMANSVWSTPPEQTRGGARARQLTWCRPLRRRLPSRGEASSHCVLLDGARGKGGVRIVSMRSARCLSAAAVRSCRGCAEPSCAEFSAAKPWSLDLVSARTLL